MEDISKFSEKASYADLFERLFDPGFLVDIEEFKILECNEACQRVLGYSATELEQVSLTTIVESDDNEFFLKSMRMTKRRYYPRQFICKFKTKENVKLFVEIMACRLKLSTEEEVMQVIAKDITKQKEAEANAREYLEKLQAANVKLEELSITDGLTKLFNVRRFKEQLEYEHLLSSRMKTPYSIIFCDVDNFKNYNDSHGHPAGDQVLCQVGKIFTQQSRKTDLVARYGGEEFVVLCRRTNLMQALILAERLRKVVSEHPFEHAKEQPLGMLSISLGVSSYPEDGKTWEEVLKKADEAVYYSKNTGRNRISSRIEIGKICPTDKN